MEGFLSLPRSARGGLAVLLAVALLGWAIVAYSAMRQHDDARSRDQAIATLKSQEDQEQNALAAFESLEERLQAAEAELATSQQAVAASHQAKSEIETQLTKLKAEFDALSLQSGEASDASGALALLDSQGSDDRTATSLGQPASVADVETLRARLTNTMTALSAKSAMLQQRERDLERATTAMEAATAEIETLDAAALERDALRERLTGTMTRLSAKNATLQQRELALAKAETAIEAATAEIESLKTAAVDRDALRTRLTETMSTLSAGTAMIQQRDRELAGLRTQLEEATTSLAAMETASADQNAAGRSLDALTAKLGKTKQALNDGASALENNEQAVAEQKARLQGLNDEQAAVEALIVERQSEADQQEQRLAELAKSVGQEEQRLAASQQKSETRSAELADLTAAGEERAAESSTLAAELDELDASLSEKEDAIAYAETELARVQGEIGTAERQLSEKQSLMNAQDVERQGVEASLAALKADRAMVEAETVEIRTAMSRQHAALDDLAALRGEIDDTKAELALQTARLDEKRDEVDAADTRGQTVRKASTANPTKSGQSLPRIPIADLSEDSLAILPIDPMQTPMPVQTDNGLRLSVVHFDLGSAELTPGGLRRAVEAAAWIKQQAADEKIRLVGATDTIGTKDDNMVLARNRARSLLAVFADEGIDPDRIEVISMGEAGGSERIDDQTAEPLNRCVGVFIGEG